jgi:hypothetical protein
LISSTYEQREVPSRPSLSCGGSKGPSNWYNIPDSQCSSVSMTCCCAKLHKIGQPEFMFPRIFISTYHDRVVSRSHLMPFISQHVDCNSFHLREVDGKHFDQVTRILPVPSELPLYPFCEDTFVHDDISIGIDDNTTSKH